MAPKKNSTILFAFWRFLAFVFKNFPVAYAALAGMAIGILFEYLALSLMIPLVGSGQGLSLSVAQTWRQFAAYMGLPDEPRIWLWLFLLVLGLRILVGLIQVSLNAKISKLIHAALSSSSFASVVSEVPLKKIYKHSVGHYMALAGDDSIRVGQLFFSLLQILSALLSAAIGLLVLYLYSTSAFVTILIFLLCCAVVLGLMVNGITSLSSGSRDLSREAVSIFVDVLNGLRSIRSMSAEGYVNSKYREILHRYTKVLFDIDLYNHSARTLPGLFLIAIGLVLFFPGTGLTQDVSVTLFFTLIIIIIRIMSFLGVAVFSAGRIVADIGAIYDLGHIMELSKASGVDTNKVVIEKVKEISISNLTCGYIDGKNILNEITGKFTAGQSYAVIGGSGSGKSTLSDVLLGLLKPVSGAITIEGVNYDEIAPLSLRQKIILVEQQTRIFSGTLRENIEFGFNSSNADVALAIQAAGLDEFLLGLDDGLETILEYQGANISGGQRQRIGLARAILRGPEVLILDEATSALDIQTRDMILQSLRTLFREKILIFITHDPVIMGLVNEVWSLKEGGLSIRK